MSFWDGPCSGAMLVIVLGRVILLDFQQKALFDGQLVPSKITRNRLFGHAFHGVEKKRLVMSTYPSLLSKV